MVPLSVNCRTHDEEIYFLSSMEDQTQPRRAKISNQTSRRGPFPANAFGQYENANKDFSTVISAFFFPTLCKQSKSTLSL